MVVPMAALILMGTGHLIGAQNNGRADSCIDSYGHRQSCLEGTRTSVDCGEGFRDNGRADSCIDSYGKCLPLCLLSVRDHVSHWCPEQWWCRWLR